MDLILEKNKNFNRARKFLEIVIQHIKLTEFVVMHGKFSYYSITCADVCIVNVNVWKLYSPVK